MAFEEAWFIGGGREHSEREARRMLYAATGRQSGIIGARSLKVTQTSPASNRVRIAPGPFLVTAINEQLGQNYGYESAPFESYQAANTGATEVEVDSTGSSGGRTDLVVARIDDPVISGGSGQAPPARIQIIRGVTPSNISSIGQLSELRYPAIALARINIPANTGTITDSMITDLRQTSDFWSETTAFGSIMQLTTPPIDTDPVNGQWYAGNTQRQVYVPAHATHAEVIGQVSNVAVGGTVGNSATGEFRPTIAGIPSNMSIQAYANSNFTSWTRLTVPLVGEVPIAPALRGTSVNVGVQHRRTHNDGWRRFVMEGADTLGSSNIPGAQVVLQITFVEKPE